ncbi:MAG: EAL domain-containing protein [Sphingomonas sp.]
MSDAATARCRTVFQPIVDADTGAAIAFQARVAEADTGGDPEARDRRRYAAAFAAVAEAGLERSDALLALPLLSHGDPQRQVATLFRAALAHRLPTERLLLEISAGSRDDPREATALMEACASRGLEIVIDGFAAAPASLRQLARFAPRFVKLDPALTRNIDRSLPRQMIAEGVVRLARTMGVTLIAQDVASRGELATLYALGIKHLQSHWIAPAVTEAQLPSRLGRQRGEPRITRAPRPGDARPALHALAG